MNSEIIILFAAVIIVGLLLFVFINLTQKRTTRLDARRYQTDWSNIKSKLVEGEPSSYHLAVLNADKLVDRALKERGIKGQIMSERMKKARSLFSNNNSLWGAHKLRNRIAHESDVDVSSEDARNALNAFEQALKDLGAL